MLVVPVQVWVVCVGSIRPPLPPLQDAWPPEAGVRVTLSARQVKTTSWPVAYWASVLPTPGHAAVTGALAAGVPHWPPKLLSATSFVALAWSAPRKRAAVFGCAAPVVG